MNVPWECPLGDTRACDLSLFGVVTQRQPRQTVLGRHGWCSCASQTSSGSSARISI